MHDSSVENDSSPVRDTLGGDDTTHGDTAETFKPDVVVDCTGGGDFETIAEAVAASISGTRIGLAPCTYTEDIDFGGKSLELRGIEGSSQTTIQGTGTGPVVTVTHGETLGTELAGVTIVGGWSSSYGAGMTLDGSVITLDDVVFSDSNTGYFVIYGTGVSLTLVDVRIEGNPLWSGGAAIYLNNGHLLAQRLRIDQPDASYGIYEHNDTLLLDSEIDAGVTAGIRVASGELHVRRSEIRSSGYAIYGSDANDTRNERIWLSNSSFVGGSTAVYTIYQHVKATNDVFWGADIGLDLQYAHAESYVINSLAVGGTCGIRGDGFMYETGWNAIPNSDSSCYADGFGAISEDPGLTDPPDDFHLLETSPLIDAGNPDHDYDDVDGSRNDIGMYGGPEGAGPP